MAEVSFGEWLKRQRGARGWTQGQLAQQLNCSVSALRKLEAEERRPSPQVVERLADLFNIPQNERMSFLQFTRGDWRSFSGGETAETPWLTSQVVPHSNLPASITSFIGREMEQEEVVNLLTKNRLVTLAGVGGIGKTRLSLQVGQKLLNDFSDGVWFVALDSLSDPALVPQTVAAIFGIREGADRPITEILTNYLRGKIILLIFDNCEHLLDACAHLTTSLLTSCPKLKILTTSRETLNVAGEATYYLPSLPIPDSEMSLEKLTEFESIRMFTERATMSSPSFTLTNQNAQTVLDICRQVDGIPLAIELAAARVNILHVEEILKQLQDSFALLASDGRTTLPRHQTLQTSMDWSWGLLGEAEQIFLRQLSVFAGGWTLESAQAVCEGDVLGLTSALVKKSLILVNQEAGSETRYRFHEIVHQYAREKLAVSGKREYIRIQHLNYFLKLSEQAELALRGSAQKEWYTRLSNERDNIRVALKWADEANVEAGLYIAGRLHRFWSNFDLSEGANWLANFLQQPVSKHYPLARAKALCVRAQIMYESQDFNVAHLEAHESLDLYRTNGDKLGEIDALLVVGLTNFLSSREEIEKLFQKALDLSESLGDQWRQAHTLEHMGWRYSNYQHSISTFEKAVAIFEIVGDNELASANMLKLVMRHMVNANVQLAQKWLDKAIKRSSNLNNKGLEMNILHHLGCLAFLKGDYEISRVNLLRAIALAQTLADRVLLLWTQVRLGYVALREGNIIEAHSIFSETAHSFQEDQNPIGVVFALEGMSSLHITSGKADLATRLIGWSDSTRENIHDTRPPLEQADVDKIIASCIAKMGEVAFWKAYEEGKKMALEEAVSLALSENKP